MLHNSYVYYVRALMVCLLHIYTLSPGPQASGANERTYVIGFVKIHNNPERAEIQVIT